jgi:CRP-like cAMP-binding protein
LKYDDDVYDEATEAKKIYIIYQGECSIRKDILFKKDIKFNKQKKTEKILFLKKGDIVGLECLENNFAYMRQKIDQTGEDDMETALNHKRIYYSNSLVVKLI